MLGDIAMNLHPIFSANLAPSLNSPVESLSVKKFEGSSTANNKIDLAMACLSRMLDDGGPAREAASKRS
jgi:hypothetical protein